MTALLKLAARHRWLMLGLLVFFSGLFALHLQDLRFDVSTEALVVQHDPAWDDYQRQKQIFGSESISVLLFRGDALLNPEVLKELSAVDKTLRALPYVSKSTSLFTVPDVRNEDGYIITRAYLDPLPESRAEIERIFTRAAGNPLVAGNLLSADGRSLAINLTLADDPEQASTDAQISAEIEALIAPLRKRLELAIQIGGPFVAAGIETQIQQDLRNMLPVSMLVLIVVLGLSLRRLQGALVPALTAGLSVWWTLGMMAWLGIPVNVMTSIVPALLVIIGSTEDVHLLAEYQWAIAQGQSRGQAIDTMSNGMGTAILLTFTTTFLGFLSIMVNDISLLSQFGMVAAMGLLTNFIITCVTVPVYLSFIGSRQRPQPGQGDGLYARIGLALFDWLIQRRLLVLLLVLGLTGLALYGASALRINSSPIDYFKAGSEIKQRANQLHQYMSGMHSFSVMLETGVEDTFLKLKYLEQVHDLQQYLDRDSRFDKTLSFVDFVALVHRSMADDEDLVDGEYLPDADALVQEYMLFIQHKLVSAYVSADYSKTRILVRHNIHSSYELNQALDELHRHIQQHVDPAVKVTISGQSILAGRAAEYMAVGQAKSLALMIIMILGVVSLLFVDSRAGVLAILPNLFPVVLLFGLMGFLQIPLDTGTIMVAVIALGICVDDTVHFMSRYHRHTRSQSNPGVALRDTIRNESTPIMTTSIALATGFSVLAWSGFVPVVNFGLLSAMVMLLALVATFVLTPILLSYISLVTMWEMLSLRLQDRVVNDCPMFRELGPWSIKQTILASAVNDYRAGEYIVEQGEAGSEMYVVLEGVVHAMQILPDGSVSRLSSMGVGSVFGEIALVSNQPRTASVLAQTDTRVLAMQWRDIRKLSRLHPRIAATVFRNLAGVLGDRLAPGSQSTHLRDELTGAYTRPFLEEQMLVEIERARRYSEPLCMVGVTLSYIENASAFEDFLLQVTASIEQLIRRVDVFARWAGRSFVILLPRTADAGAQLVVSRIREEADALNQGLSQPVEISIQLACFEGEESIQELIKKADSLITLVD